MCGGKIESVIRHPVTRSKYYCCNSLHAVTRMSPATFPILAVFNSINFSQWKILFQPQDSFSYSNDGGKMRIVSTLELDNVKNPRQSLWITYFSTYKLRYVSLQDRIYGKSNILGIRHSHQLHCVASEESYFIVFRVTLICE